MTRDTPLHRAYEAANKQFRYVPANRLADMVESPSPETRLIALAIMRTQIEGGDLPQDYFSLARRLVADPDNDCRWQALIVVSESIDNRPDAVWDVVAAFGDSPDPDMRLAIATVLLEHLLDADFDTYFPKVRDEIRKGRALFLKTLSLCAFDNNSGQNYKKTQQFLKSCPTK